MRDRIFIGLSGLFFLLFFALVGTVTLERPLTNILRARTVAPSPLKSFVAAFPQTTGIDHGETGEKPVPIKLSVYIRDVAGDSLPNREVKLVASLADVSVVPGETQTTNETGLAQFFLTSRRAGTVTLTVTDVQSNIAIVNVPTVEFTE